MLETAAARALASVARRASDTAGEKIVEPLGLMFISLAFLSLILSRLGQSNIVACILIGLAVGSSDELRGSISEDLNDAFIELGIILVMFMGGLDVNIPAMRLRWQLVLANGLGQILITWGFWSSVFGISGVTHAYSDTVFLGLACTLSSTILVVGALKNRNEVDSMHGQILLGLLGLSDIMGVLSLTFLESLDPHRQEGSISWDMLMMSTKFAGLLIILSGLTQFALTPLFRLFAVSGEMLFIGTVGYALGVAAACSMIGFSAEIGAFFSGVSLSYLPYKLEIEHRVEPIKAFGVVLFFFMLGVNLNSSSSGVLDAVPWAFTIAFLTIFVLPCLMWGLGYVTGLKARTSFLLGVLLNNISEFSLVLAQIAVRNNIFTTLHFQIVAVAMMMTLFFSSIGHLYADSLFKRVRFLLTCLDSRSMLEDAKKGFEFVNHVAIIGFNETALEIAEHHREKGEDVLVIQLDPDLHHIFSILYTPATALEAATNIVDVNAGMEEQAIEHRMPSDNSGTSPSDHSQTTEVIIHHTLEAPYRRLVKANSGVSQASAASVAFSRAMSQFSRRSSSALSGEHEEIYPHRPHSSGSNQVPLELGLHNEAISKLLGTIGTLSAQIRAQNEHISHLSNKVDSLGATNRELAPILESQTAELQVQVQMAELRQMEQVQAGLNEACLGDGNELNTNNGEGEECAEFDNQVVAVEPMTGGLQDNILSSPKAKSFNSSGRSLFGAGSDGRQSPGGKRLSPFRLYAPIEEASVEAPDETIATSIETPELSEQFTFPTAPISPRARMRIRKKVQSFGGVSDSSSKTGVLQNLDFHSSGRMLRAAAFGDSSRSLSHVDNFNVLALHKESGYQRKPAARADSSLRLSECQDGEPRHGNSQPSDLESGQEHENQVGTQDSFKSDKSSAAFANSFRNKFIAKARGVFESLKQTNSLRSSGSDEKHDRIKSWIRRHRRTKIPDQVNLDKSKPQEVAGTEKLARAPSTTFLEPQILHGGWADIRVYRPSGGVCSNIFSAYADPEDSRIWDHYDLDKAKLVVSCLERGHETAMKLARRMKEASIPFIAVATSDGDATELYEAGCRYVIQTEYLASKVVRQCFAAEMEKDISSSFGELGRCHKQELTRMKQDRRLSSIESFM